MVIGKEIKMIYLKDDKLTISFPELHPNAGVSIDLQRTLRLPDDGNTHHLPPGLGSFPLRHIEDYELGSHNALKQRGGLIMPMFQADALWMYFHPEVRDEDSVEYPIALKIGTGKICAVSGEEWTTGLNRDPQDYIVVPDQPWLDGYNVGDGIVSQFVAAPLGESLTVEEQLGGSGDVGGIQIQAFPMKKSYFDKLNRRVAAPEASMEYYVNFMKSDFMGLSGGGKMHQDIHEDEHEFSAWDQRVTERCFITIANANQWISITGEEPPISPISADAYTKAGLPWFSHYDADKKAIEGAKKLGKIKSFQSIKSQQGDDSWSKETITGSPKIVSTTSRQVVSGSW